MPSVAHRLGFLLLSLILAHAAPVPASTPDDCPRWFPDLRCDREGRWDGFHRPVVAPYLFEDPFITTGLHAVYIWHDFPEHSVFEGGDMHAFALQARLALTDRLAFIATKDGYIWKRPDLALLDDTQGHMNLAAGLKYALIRDEERNFILTPALRIEVPTGSTDTLQGHADGVLLPSVSAAWGIDRLRLIGGVGGQIPLDGAEQSGSVFYHLYGAYALSKRFAPFVQLSGITWVHSGDGKIPVQLKGGAEIPLDTAQNVLGTGRFEGADVINLGSRGVAGQDLFTWAVGAHVPVGEGFTFTASYERPFSHQKGIFKQRLMTTLDIAF